MSRINTNVSSLVAQTRLVRSNNQLQESLTRLSTGLRINSGKDDPAGLIASESLRADIASIGKAISNSERATQLIATADSALGQISSLLNDIRGLVTEAANTGVLSAEQIDANQLQVDSSLEAIDRIAAVTTFQGRKILDGSLDFINNFNAGGSTVRDLDVSQANLGSTGSVAVSVNITAAAQQALITNNAINYTTGAEASGSLTFSDTAATTATATATLSNGAIAVTAAASGTAGNGADVVLQRASDAAVATTGGTGVVLTNTGVTIDLAAVAGEAADGAAGNAVDITFATGATGGAAYASGVLTVTVAAGDDLSDILGYINSEGTFAATSADLGTTAYNAADDSAVLYDDLFTGGVNGTTSAAVNGSGDIVAQVAVGATIGAVATAINGLTDFNASATNGTNVFDHGDLATYGPTAGGAAPTASDVITIASNSTGTAFNGTLTFNRSSSVAVGAVDVQTSGSNITVTVNDNSTYNLSDLADEIQSQLSGYTVSLSATGGNGNFASALDAVVDADLAGGTNDTGTGLADDVVFKLSGNNGAEIFSFDAGTGLNDVISAINLLSDSTGVVATNNVGVLELRSSKYGTDEFVNVEVISEGAAGNFEAALSASRDGGSDVAASVNGYQANTRGNSISISNSALNFSLTVTDGSSTDVTFTIAGGGAVFQLGPDAVSSQQARIGVGAVNTGNLGGVAGRLYELRSGNANSLANDAAGAADIVDQALASVNSLRGRLGAFQRTTLETNISSLNDTLANLSAAESAIRDADFAAESAKLTRAQILVQSGTSVLQIANQNPQNVLALLRG